MDWNDFRGKMELDPEAQEKISAMAPGLFIGAVIIAAALLRGRKLPVRETAAALGERGKQVVDAAVAHVPFLPKPPENGNDAQNTNPGETQE